MYDIKEEDMDIVIDRSQSSMESQSSSLQTQLPVLELLKVRVCYYCFIRATCNKFLWILICDCFLLLQACFCSYTRTRLVSYNCDLGLILLDQSLSSVSYPFYLFIYFLHISNCYFHKVDQVFFAELVFSI